MVRAQLYMDFVCINHKLPEYYTVDSGPAAFIFLHCFSASLPALIGALNSTVSLSPLSHFFLLKHNYIPGIRKPPFSSVAEGKKDWPGIKSEKRKKRRRRKKHSLIFDQRCKWRITVLAMGSHFSWITLC